jgi:hypothetical protein
VSDCILCCTLCCCRYISAVFGEYLAWITVMNLILGEWGPRWKEEEGRGGGVACVAVSEGARGVCG